MCFGVKFYFCSNLKLTILMIKISSFVFLTLLSRGKIKQSYFFLLIVFYTISSFYPLFGQEQNTTKDSLVNISLKYLSLNDKEKFRETYPQLFMHYALESEGIDIKEMLQKNDKDSLCFYLNLLMQDRSIDALCYRVLTDRKYKKFFSELPCKDICKMWTDSVVAVPDAKLRDELWSIMFRDQGIRTLFISLPSNVSDSIREMVREEMLLIDKQNTHRVMQILDIFGKWPGNTLIGEMADQSLWLCLQHADQTPEVAKKYLPMLYEAVQQKRSDPMYYAYLFDRIRMHEGKEQVYGTQTYQKRVEGGKVKYFVVPIENVEEVDKRRIEMGMEGISEYLKEMDMIWSLEEYKRTLKENWKYYRLRTKSLNTDG